MENVLGNRIFVDMMGGRQHHLVAAMKSLPLRQDDAPANSSCAERELVAHLAADCSSQLDGVSLTTAPTCSSATLSMLQLEPLCIWWPSGRYFALTAVNIFGRLAAGVPLWLHHGVNYTLDVQVVPPAQRMTLQQSRLP